MYLETLEQGIFKIFVRNSDGAPKIVEPRQVTFDESKFLEAPFLSDLTDGDETSYSSEEFITD